MPYTSIRTAEEKGEGLRGLTPPSSPGIVLGKYSCAGCLGRDVGAVAGTGIVLARRTIRTRRMRRRVAVLVVAVDNGCHAIYRARRHSEIIEQVSVSRAGGP